MMHEVLWLVCLEEESEPEESVPLVGACPRLSRLPTRRVGTARGTWGLGSMIAEVCFPGSLATPRHAVVE
jgi:hypothetical protein